ncbi:MAG: 2-oxo acid dehydrogenase subunit E2 [Hyphomicrobiaceae bacterium]
MSEENSGDKVIPLSGMKAMIASKMVDSLQTAAQLTHTAEADVTSMLATKDILAGQGTKASVEDLLIEAVIKSLRKFPGLNGVLEDKKITLKSEINMAVAVGLPSDLLVAPAIIDAGSMSFSERVAARRNAVDRALAGKLDVKEMTSGTFTISNLGRSRVRFFTPIINAPQLAILGIGEANPRPWNVDGQIELRPVMGLSLTFDHRAVNGAPAADFLTDLCQNIEHFTIC